MNMVTDEAIRRRLAVSGCTQKEVVDHAICLLRFYGEHGYLRFHRHPKKRLRIFLVCWCGEDKQWEDTELIYRVS